MNKVKPIIPPISRELLLKELTDDKFLRKTNKGNNEIYCFSHHDSPNLMNEVGRLRELSFRSAGGGTGKETDIDIFDTAEVPYQQLIVWNPVDKEILGGYRFIICKNAERNKNGDLNLATNRLFIFSKKFKKDYLPLTIELGRSFVQPLYQSRRDSRRSLFALDNLWDGLGALTVNYPKMKYLFGKVTMYTHFNREARNYLLYFLNDNFEDKENLVSPEKQLKMEINEDEMKHYFSADSYRANYKLLSKKVRELGENIPPLINAYMNLSPGLKVFGTAINDHFGFVEETAILINVEEIYEAKKLRHVSTYIPNLNFKLPKTKFKFFKKKN